MSLLSWLDDPVSERGVEFAREGSAWERWTWADLAQAVHGAAREISLTRAGHEGPIVIIIPNSPEFIAAFYGALLAGTTPCPIAPPTVLDRPDAYAEYLRNLLTVAQPSLVLTVAEFQAHLSRREVGISCPLQTMVASRATEEMPRTREPDLALLQFTSGSSGRPRAVRVTAANLEANIRMVIDVVQPQAAVDEPVSWLPAYHDMGLIGGTLAPATATVGLKVMRPEQFILDPVRWLSCFGKDRGTIAVAPAFGFAYAAKRVADEQLEQMDFGRWRLAIIGAERIDAAVLRRFLDRLRPHGLPATLFAPAYGLAEATLLVSIRRETKLSTILRLNWNSMRFGQAVEVQAITTLDDARALNDAGEWLVSCGSPPAGASVEVVDGRGTRLPEGILGELLVGGDCVADGYEGEDNGEIARFVERGVRTGDAGLILDGELYVVGRMADSLKVRGRWVFVEDVEARVLQQKLVDRGKCVIFTGSRADGDVIVVVGETQAGTWGQTLGERLATEMGAAVRVEVLAAQPGTIARTSSGKPRRRAMWQQYMAGQLSAQRIYPSDSPHVAPVQSTTEQTPAEMTSAPG